MFTPNLPLLPATPKPAISLALPFAGSFQPFGSALMQPGFTLGLPSDQLCHDMGILPLLCLFPQSPQLRLGLSAAPGNVVFPVPLVPPWSVVAMDFVTFGCASFLHPCSTIGLLHSSGFNLCPHSNHCRLLYPGSTLAACHHVSALVSWSTCVAQSLSPSDSAWASTSASVTSCRLGSKVHHGSFLHQFHHGSSSLSSVFFFKTHCCVTSTCVYHYFNHNMNIYIYLKPKQFLYSIIFNIQLPQNAIHQQIFDKNTQ